MKLGRDFARRCKRCEITETLAKQAAKIAMDSPKRDAQTILSAACRVSGQALAA